MMKLMKKAMGSCISAKSVQSNFPVTLINDDTDEHISSGTLYINLAEVSYFPAGKVEPEYVWPLKYVRRYGRDKKIFSFEAGRRCPRGEGNFTFLTNKSEQIFKLVEFNLKCSNKVNGPNSISPASSIATTACQESVTSPQDIPSLPEKPTSRRGSPTQPEYINLEITHGPPPRPALPRYAVLHFEEETNSSPQIPSRTSVKTDYQKIDFEAMAQSPSISFGEDFNLYVNSRPPNAITYVKLDLNQNNKLALQQREANEITSYTRIDVERTIALEQTIKTQRLNVERKSISGVL